jgi:hypothetical protein
MNISTRRLFVLSLLVGLSASPLLHAADPVSEMASFSDFRNVDLNKLATGKPMTSHGIPMRSPRAMGVQACYIVHAPFQKTIAIHKQWDPTHHPELKVYLHHDLPGKPSLADFKDIASAPSNSSVKNLVAETEKLPDPKAALQLSTEEAKQFAKDGGGKGAIPPAVATFWSNVLFQRASNFVSGGISKEPPYNLSGDSIKASEEVSKLLEEQPKIYNEFKSLLGETGLKGSGKLAPALYYELFDVEGQGAFTLGASYFRQSGDTWQGIDAQYYSSGGYYALVTFYQAWPVKIGSEDATLVWRGDLISSGALAELHGVERMGSTGAMMKAIQKNINLVQKDAAGSH